MLPQVVCECWYGEVMKQSRSQLAMKGADWRDRVAKEARGDNPPSLRITLPYCLKWCVSVDMAK